MRKRPVGYLVLVILVLQASMLAGCRGSSEKSERASDDWSRGVHLGQAAINGRVGLATDELGENIYLVWVAERKQTGDEFLRFVRLDRWGRVLAERDLRIGVDRPTQVEVAFDPHDNLHLTWVDRVAGVRCLFYARLDRLGRLTSYPKPISLPKVSVESYTMGLDEAGGVTLFWGAKEGEQAGLYHTRLDKWGETAAENLHLGVEGFDPAFRTDRRGISHLVWLDEPDYGEYHVRYATFDVKDRFLSRSSEVAVFSAPTGLIARRPSVGLAGDGVYVFWSLERRGGGLTQSGARSYCVAFPLGHPDMAGSPRSVQIPALKHARYGAVDSEFAVEKLASTAQRSVSSEFVCFPGTSQGHRDELATAFAAQIVGRTKGIVQIVLAVWGEGELKGYQIAARTRSMSLKPVLVADAQNDLHLAWIDAAGFGNYSVYYASTSSEARARLNRVTGQDVVSAILDLAWAMVQALSLFPIAMIWFLPPCMLLAVYVFVRAEGDLSRLGSRVMLVIAVFAYMGFKYLFRPNWLAALPLPRGLPSVISNVVTYATPLVVSGVAGVASWLYVRQRESPQLLPAFGVFAASDALITLLVYVPGILAE